MKLNHTINFDFRLALDSQAAIAFVRDVEQSLATASFIENLRVVPEELLEHDLIQASIPINAAMFGQHNLSFQSLLIPTLKGARLQALPFDTPKAGWAEVAGEAVVRPLPENNSSVHYTFEVTIHLQLPTPERWGGQALLKMVKYTANRVLETVVADFPKAIQDAAKIAEAAYITQHIEG